MHSHQLPAAIFFDVGDTLVRAHPSWAGVYQQGLAAAGIHVEHDRLADGLRAATQAGLWDIEGAFDATEQASYERVKRFDAAVLASLGLTDLDDAVFRRIEAEFALVSAWHVFPDVQPAIEALRMAGLRLGVISNWLWGAPELMHELRLAVRFDALAISARVGYQKPHPRIFEHALAQLGVAPADALHVGDSYRADVQGARGVGMAAVLIDRSLGDPARPADRHGEADVPVVRDLLELLDLLAVPRPAGARHA